MRPLNIATNWRTKRLGASCFGAEIKIEDFPNKKQIHNGLKGVSATNG